MPKLKITCPQCNRVLEYPDTYTRRKIKCRHCKNLIPIPMDAYMRSREIRRRRKLQKWLAVAAVFIGIVIAFAWLFHPVLHWPDHRPIGVVMLASTAYSTPANPRGWFNEPRTVFTGTNGAARFRSELLAYADRTIAILKRTGAQGVIIWDLEGQEYPHKISYIGDPRQVTALAPEMDAVADDFFARFRAAGLRVGVTIRPQQFGFNANHLPQQSEVLNTKALLQAKIDYACTRWGATLFYVDSNGGVRWPDEVWQIRRLAAARPDILLLPEHCLLPFSGFSAPYVSLRNTRKTGTVEPSTLAQKLFPDSLQALDISDATDENLDTVSAAHLRGDILLFRAWFWSPECQMLEDFTKETTLPDKAPPPIQSTP